MRDRFHHFPEPLESEFDTEEEYNEAQDFPFWEWGHVLTIVWRLVKVKALAVTSHEGSLYCSLLIDAE